MRKEVFFYKKSLKKVWNEKFVEGKNSKMEEKVIIQPKKNTVFSRRIASVFFEKKKVVLVN